MSGLTCRFIETPARRMTPRRALPFNIRPRNSASWRHSGLAEQLEFVPQPLPGLAALRVKDDAIGGADENALRFFEIANAFSAFFPIDDEDVFARMDGFIGALGLACIAVDTIGRYQ
jgi:hypothetical protein